MSSRLEFESQIQAAKRVVLALGPEELSSRLAALSGLLFSLHGHDLSRTAAQEADPMTSAA